MKLLLSILLPLTGFAALGHEPDREKAIEDAVERQMKSYPRSTLRDLYKNFFQDRFGPGHLIGDTAAAGAYLREELASRVRFGGVPYEPTGCSGNFYRVNLSVVREGLVDYRTFFDAFLRSADGIATPPPEEWKKEWTLIESVISRTHPDLDGYARDSAEIAGLLERGKYAVHHSRAFNEAYDFHYRIISKGIFESQILPSVEARAKPMKQDE